MRLVNLTPHSITLQTETGERITLASEGVARVDATHGALENVEGVPIPVAGPTVYGDVIGLPDPVEGVMYVVSAIVLSRCAGRVDVLAPGTGPKDGAIRNAQGQVEAVTRLVR